MAVNLQRHVALSSSVWRCRQGMQSAAPGHDLL